MKKLMMAIIGALTTGLLFGDTFTWKGGTGAFTDTAMWEEGSAPTSGADLVFPSGDNVVTDIGTFEVNAIALNGATELQFGSAGGTFKVNGVISGSGSLKSVGNAAAASHIELRGDNTFTGGYTNWGGDTLVYHANALGTGKAVFQSNGQPGYPLKAYTSSPIPNDIDVSHEYPYSGSIHSGSIQAGGSGATFNGKVTAVANKFKTNANFFRLQGTMTFNGEINFAGNYGIVGQGNLTFNKAMTGSNHYLAINSGGISLKVNASSNYLSSIQWDNGYGYIYLNAENVFASPERIVFAQNDQKNSGGLYVNASQVVEDISQNYEPNGSCSVVGGADPVTVTMQATANRAFSGKFTGDISLVWDPTGDFTYTVKGTTKSPGESTTIGGIAVNKGTFQVSEGASFAKITKVGVKAGATLAFAAGCACGTELTELKLQEGASFTIADGASLYVSKFITVDANGNETVMPKAVYTSADCPALGEGITVFPVASDLAYVGADGGDLCDKDNWEGGVAPTIYDIGVIPAGITSLTVSGPLTSGGLTFNGTDAVAITGEGKLALPDTGDFKLTSGAALTLSVEITGKARIVSKGNGNVTFNYSNPDFSGGIYREVASVSDATSRGNIRLYKAGGLGTGDVYLKGNTGLVVGEKMIVANNIAFEQSVNNYYAQLVSNPSGTEFTGTLDFSKAICPRSTSAGSVTYHDLVLKQGANHSWEEMLIAKSNTHYFKGHISGKGTIGSDTYSAWMFYTSLNDLDALDFYGLKTSSTCWADVKDIFTADTQIWMYTGAGATAQSFNLEGYDQTVESVFDKGGTVATSVHKHYISNAAGKTPATITMKGTANRTYTGLFSDSLSFTWEPTGDYTYTIHGAENSMNGKLWAKKGTIAVEGATDFSKVSEIEVGEDAAITFAEGTTLSPLLKKLTLGKNAALTVTDDVKAEEVYVTDSDGKVTQLQAGDYTVPGVTGGKVVVTKHIEEPTVEVISADGSTTNQFETLEEAWVELKEKTGITNTVRLLRNVQGNLWLGGGNATTLDLNGYTLTGTNATISVITINSNAALTLTDTSAEQTGKVTMLDGATGPILGGGVYNYGTFTMSGGTIADCSANFGGGVYDDPNSTFTMSGGTITGCSAKFGGGGGVYNNGTFTMSGGKVANAIYSNNSTGTIEISGGLFGNEAKESFKDDWLAPWATLKEHDDPIWAWQVTRPDLTMVKVAEWPARIGLIKVVSGVETNEVAKGATSFTVPQGVPAQLLLTAAEGCELEAYSIPLDPEDVTLTLSADAFPQAAPVAEVISADGATTNRCETLEEAWGELKGGAGITNTVRLLRNVQGNLWLNSGIATTLDLNGCTLTGTNATEPVITIGDGAVLMLTDTSEKQTGIVTMLDGATGSSICGVGGALAVEKGATLVIAPAPGVAGKAVLTLGSLNAAHPALDVRGTVRLEGNVALNLTGDNPISVAYTGTLEIGPEASVLCNGKPFGTIYVPWDGDGHLVSGLPFYLISDEEVSGGFDIEVPMGGYYAFTVRSADGKVWRQFFADLTTDDFTEAQTLPDTPVREDACLFVNGADVGKVSSGEGWRILDNTLLLDAGGTFVISGNSSVGNIPVRVGDEATLILSSAVLYTTGCAALDLTAASRATILAAGATSYLASKNAADGASVPAVVLGDKTELTLAVAPGADPLETLVVACNYGDSPAVVGKGKVIVIDGSFAAWADVQGLEGQFAYDPVREIMSAGADVYNTHYTEKYVGQPSVIVGPVRTLTIRDIPHVTGVTVLDSVNDKLAGSDDKEGVTTYRLMVDDIVKVHFDVEPGYTIQIPNPIVYESFRADTLLDASNVPILPNIDYVAWDEATASPVDGVCSNYTPVTNGMTVLESGWYVVAGAVTTTDLKVNGEAHLILCDGAKLTATGGVQHAGIEVASGNTLAIYGQTLGAGELVATGGEGVAGIGGGQGGTGGTVEFGAGAWLIRAGDDAQSASEVSVTSYTEDHSAAYVQIHPIVAEVISADGSTTNAYTSLQEAWGELKDETGITNTVRLLRNVQGNLWLNGGNATTLDLNGYTLTGTNAKRSVIDISPNAALTLTDTSAKQTGKVTMLDGATDPNNGGGVYNYGMFMMSGGMITGCSATNNGGGVYNCGTFTMTGGTISGCTANAGGGVYNNATFTMSGGKVANAIYKAIGSTINISGGLFGDEARNSKMTDSNKFNDWLVRTAEVEPNTDEETKGAYPWRVVSGPRVEVISADGSTTNQFETLEVAWGELQDETGITNTVRLLRNVQGNLWLNGGNATTLDLNGCTLTGTNATKSVITINPNAALTLKDTSAKQTGKVTMLDGATGPTLGGGVFNDGTFTMSGGTIANCTAMAGGGVFNKGMFTMTCGKMANAIYNNVGTIEISGGLFGNEAKESFEDGWLAPWATLKGPLTDPVWAWQVTQPDLTTVKVVEWPARIGSIKVVSGSETNEVAKGATSFTVPTGVPARLLLTAAEGCELEAYSIPLDPADDTLTLGADNFPSLQPVAEVISADGATTNRFETLEAAWGDLATWDKAITNTVRLLRNVEGNLWLGGGNATTLDLNGCTLTGSGSDSVIEISSNAALTLTDTSAEQTGKVTMSEGASGSGNGGGVANNGTFTMAGGAITDCKAMNGGGVFNNLNSTFTMTGGTIANCTTQQGGGVNNNGTFTMTGGTIANCSATMNGGGVFNDGTFTMSGGAVANAISNTGTIEISGGLFGDAAKESFKDDWLVGTAEVEPNTDEETKGAYPWRVVSGPRAEVISADGVETNKFETLEAAWGDLDGQGNGITNTVRLLRNVQGNLWLGGGNATTLDLNGFTLTGTNATKSVITIDWNAALTLTDTSAEQLGKVTMLEGVDGPQQGGGVINYGTFTMVGGTIADCSANFGGGVNNVGTFTMSGGTIANCSATLDGGGVYNNSNATFMMTDGKVENCTATYGGGVYNYGTFTMSGGTIADCSANFGGGVYNDRNSTFTMSGGTITGCKATINGGGVWNGGTFTMMGGKMANEIFNAGTIEISDGLFGEEAKESFEDDWLAPWATIAEAEEAGWWRVVRPELLTVTMKDCWPDGLDSIMAAYAGVTNEVAKGVTSFTVPTGGEILLTAAEGATISSDTIDIVSSGEVDLTELLPEIRIATFTVKFTTGEQVSAIAWGDKSASAGETLTLEDIKYGTEIDLEVTPETGCRCLSPTNYRVTDGIEVTIDCTSVAEENTHLVDTNNFAACRELKGDHLYIFTENVEYTAADTESAMMVESGTVHLYIPSDVTVTLTGGDADGAIGAGAGIEVLENAGLHVFGEGMLVAMGGEAAGGCNGENASASWVNDQPNGKGKDCSEAEAPNGDMHLYFTNGAGGAGGAGGGGAGAGIGGRGGNGGAGGAGGAALTLDWWDEPFVTDGDSGAAGSRGGAGGVPGKISIAETVLVKAQSGAAEACGGEGGEGTGVSFTWWSNYWGAWGGGGGGGGGAGGAADGIGNGGNGGNGGGGGGAGAIDRFGNLNQLISHDQYGIGGQGGLGMTGFDNGNGGDGKNKYGEHIEQVENYARPGLGGAGVAGADELPADFTQVEYIESTKDGGQYIDTDYTAGANTKVVIDAYLPPVEKQYNDSVVLFGARSTPDESKGIDWSTKAFSIQLLGLKCIRFAYNGEYVDSPERTFDERITITCDNKHVAWTGSDAGSKAVTVSPLEQSKSSLYIFGDNTVVEDGDKRNGAFNRSVMRLYSFKIYEDEELKRDFVPCVAKATGEAGLFDLVEGKFYNNRGSTAFVAGSVVVKPVTASFTLGEHIASVSYTTTGPNVESGEATDAFALKVLPGTVITLKVECEAGCHYKGETTWTVNADMSVDLKVTSFDSVEVISADGATTKIYTSLQEALDNVGEAGAAETNTVRLLRDVQGDVKVESMKAAILDLNGWTLTGSGEKSVITIKGNAALTLTDTSDSQTGKVTMLTGAAGPSNGGVYNNGGTFTMSGGTIADCKATYGGGVCNNPNSTFTMTGGTIANCTATMFGGGVYNSAGGTFTMLGGTITVCKAATGGGVHNVGTFTMSGGEIANCSATTGGGVCNNVNSTFTMSGGTIAGCKATNNGGGVHNSGTFTMTGGAVKDAIAGGGNYSISGGLFGKTFDKKWLAEGAVMEDNLDPATMDEYPKVVKTYYVAEVISAAGATTNAYTSLQEALDNVGKAGAAETNTVRLIRNVEGDVKVMADTAAILDLNGWTLTGSGSNPVITIKGNAALTLTDTSDSQTGKVTMPEVAAGPSYGGGVYNNGGTFTMSGGTIADCKATYGGGVCNYVNSTFTMSGGTIADCKATNSGGGVYNNRDSTFTMLGGMIKDCSAAKNGGGVRNDVTFTMSGGTIANCSAENGGGVYNNTGGTFTMSGGTITNCTAATNGGGGVNNSGKFTMTGGAVKDAIAGGGNYSISGGLFGAAAMDPFIVNYLAEGAVVEDNLDPATKDEYPMVVKTYYVAEVISAAGATTNAYTSLQAALNNVGEAGAAETNTVRLSRNVKGNVEVKTGTAAILDFNGYTLTGTNATISVITINSNAALTLTDTSESQTGKVTMPEDAPGSNFGGGVYNNNGTFTMAGGMIANCTATGKGGGVYNSGTFTMLGGTITNCTATGNGGGVYNNTVATFTMEGGTIAGCETTNVGGGVWNYGTFTMSGGTIANCTATGFGGGVFSNAGTFTMTGGAVKDAIEGNGNGSISGGLFGKTFGNSWLAEGAAVEDNPDLATEAEYPNVVRGENNYVVMVRTEGLESLVVSNGTESVEGYLAAGYRIFEVAKGTEINFAYEEAEGYAVKVDAPTTLTVNADTVIYPVKSRGPTCEGGEIAEGADGVWFVTPASGVTEVTVRNLPEGAFVAVPPTITRVNGVNDAQVKVKSGAYDITGAFTITNGAIAFNENGVVNGVPVKPTIGDLDEGEAFVVGEGSAAVTVRTIPGLKYSLVRGTELGAITTTVVEPTLATEAQMTLEDTDPPKDQAFYRVVVSMP